MVRRINKAAVIGSGIMGGGIAALLAAAGVDMLLLDIVPFDLKEEEKKDKKARNRIVTMGLEGAIRRSRRSSTTRTTQCAFPPVIWKTISTS